MITGFYEISIIGIAPKQFMVIIPIYINLILI